MSKYTGRPWGQLCSNEELERVSIVQLQKLDAQESRPVQASPQRLPATGPRENVSYNPLGELEQYPSNDALHQSSGDLNAQTWIADRLPNINWLSEPMNGSGNASGSFDSLPWLFEDNQLWGDLQNLPFGTSPLPRLFTNPPIRRTPEALLDTSTVSTESPATSSAPPIEKPGQFYVDGSESRLPRVKRRKQSSKSGPKSATPIDKSFSLSAWTNLSSRNEAAEVYQISPQVYQSIGNAFKITCLRNTAPSWMAFGGAQSIIPFTDQASPSTISSAAFASDLPPKEVFEYLLTLYMEHIQPTLPLFRSSDLPSDWQLLTAMCALGSHFGGAGMDQFIISMHEFLRRVLHLAAEDPSWLSSNGIEIAQIKLLHTVGLLYCGDERLLEYGIDNRLHAKHVDMVWNIANREYHDWETWQRIESARRTGYAIWLVDCMMAFHFHQKPFLQLEYADIVLPCPQKVWLASDRGEWEDLSKRYPNPPTLAEALQQLYVEKKLPQDLGEFARVLIVHGIFHRTWEVEKYYQQPLSRWSPTAEKQSSEELNTKTPIWLPSVPTFAKWRNSACDCLDILHWSANAAIGAASGMEPPQVMHLHLARVVLLTPHKHIVSLAHYLAGESTSHSSEEAALDRQVIRRWATQDQYKARLAMIHAGVMFWNVRRFSTNGFYEPTSVALAALALWAFSAFSARPSSGTSSSNANDRTERRGNGNYDRADNDGDPSGGQNSSQEEDTYDIILLDRPTDDELVQQFVRRGHNMKANMNGVGDLYGERGAEKVLVEGSKLLSTLHCWAINDKWIRILDKLVVVTKQERANTVTGIS